MTIKLQPQSGLGDLIFALPLIEKLVSEGREITVATNHSYVLKAYDGEQVRTVPVEFEHRLPVIQHDAHPMKYNRYGVHYFVPYFEAFYPDAPLTFNMSVAKVRERFTRYCSLSGDRLCAPKFYIFAPARAALRHKHLPQPFECAPMRETVAAALERARATGLPGVTVGQNEIYADGDAARKQTEYDFTDGFDFWWLSHYIVNAERVISQVSAITALAGLLGTKTDFLPARAESATQHATHVDGVVWPGQEVV